MQPPPETSIADRLINRRQLRELIPVTDMTIWRWEKAGLFPRHLSINGRNYWRLSEIVAWLESQSADRLSRKLNLITVGVGVQND
jgi:prophage regulatory protein